jgi:anti-sigma factor RsiW
VDGALSDTERRSLLARLEVEPDAWRRCALAFLEAQSWREALDPAATAGPEPRLLPGARHRLLSAPGRVGLRSQYPAWSLAAVAAGLVAAFALGWSARGVPTSGMAAGSLVKTDDRAVSRAPSLPAASKPAIDPQTEPLAARSSSPSSAPFDPFVRAWERRGYQVEHSQRLVSMELENGRRVAVPINEVRLRFVGHRTY